MKRWLGFRLLGNPVDSGLVISYKLQGNHVKTCFETYFYEEVTEVQASWDFVAVDIVQEIQTCVLAGRRSLIVRCRGSLKLKTVKWSVFIKMLVAK